MDKAAVADVCRSVGIGNIQGIDLMTAVLWHTSSAHSEKMLHALCPYFEQIGQLVVRLVPCVSNATFTSCDCGSTFFFLSNQHVSLLIAVNFILTSY